MSVVLILRLAGRNLLAHKAKSVLMAGLLFFGGFLVVFGTSIVDSMDRSIERTVTESLAGHLHVYSSEARDRLGLFGDAMAGSQEIGQITDFRTVRQAIEGVPGVKAVVPLGIGSATMSERALVAHVLDDLRAAAELKDTEAVDEECARLREIVVNGLVPVFERRKAVSSDRAALEDELADLARVARPDFVPWVQRDPTSALQWLDSRIAPLAEEETRGIRYIGTDLTRFADEFPRFEVVEGGPVPPGRRGVLLEQRFFETALKAETARTLDRLRKAVVENGQHIAGSPQLEAAVRRLARGSSQLLIELSAESQPQVEAELRKRLGDRDSLAALLAELLAVDDGNLEERYRIYYEVVAPRIRLHSVTVGDVVTLRSVARTGFPIATNVRVYGTFRFRGLEDSAIRGMHAITDLVTFRDLYGLMTDARREEVTAIQSEMGSTHGTTTEEELFGGSSPLVVASRAAPFGDPVVNGIGKRSNADEFFDPVELDRGVALSAAIVLESADRIEEDRRAIQHHVEEAGLKLRVVDWRDASGMVGQYFTVVRVILYIATVIVFMVGLVIMSNAMTLAMMNRIHEIGTVRAMGASRPFVAAMFLVETGLLTLGGGGAGVAAGGIAVKALARTGIPAWNEQLRYLFSDSVLHPSVGIANLLIGLAAVLVLGLAAALYPTWVAVRVSPVVAMADTGL